jgi:hypothetical protein
VACGGARQATASLVVGKWSAASRQNTLAAALKEWGMLRRTIHAARYLSDPAYRRKIARQLNKGESLHALRRDLHYARQGTTGKPHLADQSEQAWCLTVLTNSVITRYPGFSGPRTQRRARELCRHRRVFRGQVIRGPYATVRDERNGGVGVPVAAAGAAGRGAYVDGAGP